MSASALDMNSLLGECVLVGSERDKGREEGVGENRTLNSRSVCLYSVFSFSSSQLRSTPPYAWFYLRFLVLKRSLSFLLSQ